MFVDWAGATIPVYDRHSGQAWQAPLFVAALGASSYTWAEATCDQQMEAWLKCHVHTFEHFHGIPQLAVPDNCKTGLTKAHRYDPDLNPTYYNFAVHCGFGIVPARPRKPRDKAKVENAVQVAQRWIVAALRHRKFFALEDLNEAIHELLAKLNHRPFRKKDGTRASAWEAIDKPALKPLPMQPFDLSEWSRARVNSDYHVVFDANVYSVPYNLVHELVEIRSTPTIVEILHQGTRPGQKRDPRAGAEVGVGPAARKHFRARTDRCRQELRGMRTGAESLPRWILGHVRARSRVVPRSRHRPRRRQSTHGAGTIQPH